MTTDVQRALADLVDVGAVAPGTEPGDVIDLVVSHARSLDGLEEFTRLRTLSLLSCEVGDYAPVASLRDLRVLAIENSDLVDLTWAESLGLYVAVLRNNRIRNAMPVIRLADLQVIDLSGNPLDPDSRSAARALTCPFVTLDADDLADVNVKLADAGLTLVGYRVGDTVWACATGLTLTGHPEAGHIVTSIDQLAATARGEQRVADLLGLEPDSRTEGQMREAREYRAYGPGMKWLARRTGKTPGDLASAPGDALAALTDAIREVAALAARSASPDEQVRAEARAEAERLGKELEGAPSPGETFGRRIAAALRDQAERLREADRKDP